MLAPENSSRGMRHLPLRTPVNEMAMDLAHAVSIVPFEHALHRRSEIDSRLPAEFHHCACRIRYNFTHVVAADGDNLDRRVRCKAEVLPHEIVDFLDRAPSTRRHVERPNYVRRRHCKNDGRDE